MASGSDLANEISPVDFIQLQEYIEYSSLKAKDAMRQFDAGGTLVQHRTGDHTDSAGLSLFLKHYLEVEDLPADLSQHLFQYFNTVEQNQLNKEGGVSLKAVSCYFSILEEGNPRDKLEYTFKLYDKDDNGLLDSTEVEKIVTQMMKAAEYLGWDVSELKPDLRDMLKAMDVDCSGTVTLQEWIQGGLNNIPLLVLLGLKVPDKDGQHVWRLKNFSRPTYCFVCQNMMLGLRKQGLACNICKLTVHSSCANKNQSPCVKTFVRSRTEIGCSVHDWISTDCESSRCEICQKKIKILTGKRCSWCHQMLDEADTCAVLGENLLNMTSEGHFLQIFPVMDTLPLLVFVNPKSGGRQGKRVLRKFQFLLNPRQVFDLTDGGPNPGLQFFRNLPGFRVLVCGGDGTVGWVLDAIDKADLRIHPPVAILPLGTGNDLARCLNWGGGYEGADLTDILKQIEESSVLQMDRWSLSVVPDDAVDEGDPVPNDIINNYFSIGVDASIAHQFHLMREKHPQKFNSRVRNKLWYFQLATSETISATCRNLKDCLTIESSGSAVDLSRLSLEGVAVLNIPSMHGGSNLWGETPCPEKPSHEVTVEAVELESCAQGMSDGLLEVVGLESVLEMGQIYSGLKRKAHRLLQAPHITLRTSKTLPMQIDGEPWMQPPCTIQICHRNQVKMLMASSAKAPGCFLK
ncbi:hypothetical protein DNTS_008263 [Danionella cerebrum]|nr:hypothetical protein DNTS_008263 [Danionella translucida]TRY97757.1 hypothetical protein DNTS_008263 [Danionella translucida]TRY97758.1 hypothetical protein DNTS_008263 [Danionella translucida]TRY97759.1 hypothetical protein DNTS_008263 [Danionella translucida]